MMSLVRPELPTASVGSSQATTAAVDNSAQFAICPKSTYKSGNAVQTSGATSVCCAGGNVGKARLLPEQWLLIEWPADQAEPEKYYLHTLPETSALNDLVSAAHMRWRIERDYQDLKQDLGLGHYEGRGWRGFHHHASLSIAAYGFLVAQRLKAGGDASVKKNFIVRQMPAVPDDYIPRGSPARVATRGGLDHDTASSVKHRTGKRPRTLSALWMEQPKT